MNETMFSDILSLFVRRRQTMKNWHDTNNLASQRNTGSLFNKGTNSLAFKIPIISETTGYPLCSLTVLMGKSMKLAI